MIWVNIQLMTAVDVLIMAFGAYVAIRVYKTRSATPIPGRFISQGLIAAGLFAIVIFFADDLYSLWATQIFSGTKTAMSAMEALHLNLNWFVISLAVCLIAIGLLRVQEDLNIVAERAVESEGHLREIMNSIADGIITIDEQGLVDSINHTASRMFGYTAEEILGKNVLLLMPEPHRSKHDRYISNYLETGKARIIGIGPRELFGQRKDGTVFELELAVSESRSGESRLFIGAIRDISDRKKHQQQLQQAQKMEAIGQLTGGIAHDFNNLLSVILGNLEFLKDHIPDDRETRKFTEHAMDATLHGADLTQRLLAFSRTQPLQPEPTEINQCLSAATELMRRTLGEDIEIETVLAGGL